MCGGGGGDPAAEARKMEEERQARIKAATDQINHIFNGSEKVTKTRLVPGIAGSYQSQPVGSGEDYYMADVWVPGSSDKNETYDEWVSPQGGNPRDKLYADQRSTVYDLNSREVNRQAGEATRNNGFALARNGLGGGSVDVDSMAEINRRTNEGLLRAGGIADQSSADLRGADEKTRSNLISMAQSGIDTGSAATMSLNGLKVNAEGVADQRSGSTIGRLFDDMGQAYLVNQINQGRLAANQAGSQFFGSQNSRSGGYNGNVGKG